LPSSSLPSLPSLPSSPFQVPGSRTAADGRNGERNGRRSASERYIHASERIHMRESVQNRRADTFGSAYPCNMGRIGRRPRSADLEAADLEAADLEAERPRMGNHARPLLADRRSV